MQGTNNPGRQIAFPNQWDIRIVILILRYTLCQMRDEKNVFLSDGGATGLNILPIHACASS
jgi:hypothetical protein